MAQPLRPSRRRVALSPASARHRDVIQPTGAPARVQAIRSPYLATPTVFAVATATVSAGHGPPRSLAGRTPPCHCPEGSAPRASALSKLCLRRARPIQPSDPARAVPPERRVRRDASARRQRAAPSLDGDDSRAPGLRTTSSGLGTPVPGKSRLRARNLTPHASRAPRRGASARAACEYRRCLAVLASLRHATKHGGLPRHRPPVSRRPLRTSGPRSYPPSWSWVRAPKLAATGQRARSASPTRAPADRSPVVASSSHRPRRPAERVTALGVGAVRSGGHRHGAHKITPSTRNST